MNYKKENERLNDLLDFSIEELKEKEEELKEKEEELKEKEEENESLKNQIAKDQPFVEQCKAWCRYHASKRKERKEQEAYNRLLKIRKLEKENKRLKDLLA